MIYNDQKPEQTQTGTTWEPLSRDLAMVTGILIHPEGVQTFPQGSPRPQPETLIAYPDPPM